MDDTTPGSTPATTTGASPVTGMAGGNAKEPETPGTVEDGCDTGARDVVLDIAGITPGSSPASVPGSTHAVATMARTTSSSPNRRIRIPPRRHRHSSADSTRVLWAHCGIYRTTNPGLAAACIGRPTLGTREGCRERHPSVWRWGESNPRPERHQRRHLRAQPTASFRNTRTLSASTLMPYPGLSFPAGPGNPGGGVPHCVALIRRGGHPPGGQERLSTLPVRNFRLHLYVYRLFNEDSGDLGSLPAPQLSRSKPCHPRVAGT